MDLLNYVWVDNIDDDTENYFKERFICEFDENYPKDVLYMFKYNEPAITGNEVVLHNLPCELYRIVVNDKIPENCKYPLATIQDTRNQNQTNTGLAKLL